MRALLETWMSYYNGGKVCKLVTALDDVAWLISMSRKEIGQFSKVCAVNGQLSCWIGSQCTS